MLNKKILHLIEANGLLNALKERSPKEVSKEKLRTCSFALKLFLTELNIYSSERIQKILEGHEFIFLTYRLFREEYLFWLSIRLSIADRGHIQTILHKAIDESGNRDLFKKDIENIVVANYMKFCDWASDSIVNEIKIWLEVQHYFDTESIFEDSVKQLLILELIQYLQHKEQEEDLVSLILSNDLPKNKIGIRSKSIQRFVGLFKFLKENDQLKDMTYKILSKWLVNRFDIYVKGERLELKEITCLKYLEKDHKTQKHIRDWFK